MTVELVCTAFGELGLPTKPGQLRSYIESLKTKEPIPEWLLDTAEMLSEFEEITVAECAIRTSRSLPFPSGGLLTSYCCPQIPRTQLLVIGSTMKTHPVFLRISLRWEMRLCASTPFLRQ